MAAILTDKTKQAIINDSSLAAAVCEALGIKIVTLPAYLSRNNRRLTDYAVLKIIAQKLGVEIDSLIVEVDAEIEAAA
jgi:transcriptional regulator with XRE-family HTH domain